MSNKVGGSTTLFYFEDRRKLKGFNKKRKKLQIERFEKEDNLFEMIQLSNGDFKKVKK